MTITVVIPSIPPRAAMLARALASIEAQTRPSPVIVTIDADRQGAAATRNRGLEQVDTEWVAFLDDDDELLPQHLDALLAAARSTGADVVFPAYRVVDSSGREKRLPKSFDQLRTGEPFDPDLLRAHESYIPVTTLVRTERALAVGGFSYPESRPGRCEDWGFALKLLDDGCRFHHHPEVTWTWHHHRANTSGQPDRW